LAFSEPEQLKNWIPACAGMTKFGIPGLKVHSVTGLLYRGNSSKWKLELKDNNDLGNINLWFMSI